MDVARIVADLKLKRERINRAILTLEGSASTLGEKKVSGAAPRRTRIRGEEARKHHSRG